MTPDQSEGRLEVAARRRLAAQYGMAIERLMPQVKPIVDWLKRQESIQYGEQPYKVDLAVTYVKMVLGKDTWIYPSAEIRVRSEDTVTTYRMPFDRKEEDEPTISQSSKTQGYGMWEETERIYHDSSSAVFSQVHPVMQYMIEDTRIQEVTQAFGADLLIGRIGAELGEGKITKVTLSTIVQDEEFIRR